ncbi:lipopolysaccharide biosynthesis protein [Streptomyces sp. NPDC051987]|uniref:lipopolysaccharide biosynthesis protein n=1 Tax=Streptomyces sp. NPDC051987 TaxID=3155808 RepID=UPI003431D5B4
MTENPDRAPRSSRRAVPPWSLLAAGVLTGGLLGGAYGVLTPPSYTATAYVIAVPADKSDTAAAQGFAQAYGRVATQLAVLDDAQMWAGVPLRTLQDSVRTETSPDAPMVAVSATSPHALQATDMANAVVRSLVQHANGTKGATNVELIRFSRALKPTAPTSASTKVTALVGASAGGLLGGLVLLVRPRRRVAESAVQASVPGPAVAADVRGQL